MEHLFGWFVSKVPPASTVQLYDGDVLLGDVSSEIYMGARKQVLCSGLVYVRQFWNLVRMLSGIFSQVVTICPILFFWLVVSNGGMSGALDDFVFEVATLWSLSGSYIFSVSLLAAICVTVITKGRMVGFRNIFVEEVYESLGLLVKNAARTTRLAVDDNKRDLTTVVSDVAL